MLCVFLSLGETLVSDSKCSPEIEYLAARMMYLNLY